MKKLLLALMAVFAINFAQAQTQVKIAYTNADSILRALPETKVQEGVLQKYGEQLQLELQSKQTTLETKAKKLESEKDNLPQIVLQERVQELQELDQKLRQFQQRAQQDIAQKEQELLGPILQKIEKGINEVAKEKGYGMVLPANALLYADEAHDITELVIAKLKSN